MGDPTAGQISAYNLHRTVCLGLNIPQSILHHKGLQGTVTIPMTASTPVARTANKIYTGPPARTQTAPTVDTLVWFVAQPQRSRSGDEGPFGFTSQERMMGQMPTIDDNGDPITVAQEDTIEMAGALAMTIRQPSVSPDGGFWVFDLDQRR